MKDDGGVAFPGQHEVGESGEYWMEHTQGMSLRDYFAAKAMEGLISAEVYEGDFFSLAHKAYIMADAMLEERK